MPSTPTFKPNWRFTPPYPECPVAGCFGMLTEDWVMQAWDCHTCGGRFSDMYLYKLDQSHSSGTVTGRMSSKQSNVPPRTAGSKQYKSTWRRPECPIAGCNSGILVPIIGTDKYECNLCNARFSDSYLKLLSFSYVLNYPSSNINSNNPNQSNQPRKATPMPQNTRVKILWDDSVAAFRVATPYNPQFVDLLKNLIPIADRVWDPQSKIWTIGEKYGLPVKQLCVSIYGASDVTFVDRAASHGNRTATGTQAQAQQAQQYAPPPVSRRGEPIDLVMLNFIKVLPYEAAQAAYRKAAMALHPDRNNGDASKMTLLNTTWSRIEKEFYGRVS